MNVSSTIENFPYEIPDIKKVLVTELLAVQAVDHANHFVFTLERREAEPVDKHHWPYSARWNKYALAPVTAEPHSRYG